LLVINRGTARGFVLENYDDEVWERLGRASQYGNAFPSIGV